MTPPHPTTHNAPKQVLAAKAALQEFLPVFPDILKGVKTEMAARVLLHRYRSLVRWCVGVSIDLSIDLFNPIAAPRLV